MWLLLKNAFEQGYRRLEWKCDSMNIASRRAAERLGFTWEGCLRQKMVRKGRTRDSDQLSIIDSECRSVMRRCAHGWRRRILMVTGDR
ncbi:Uncharacterised protein [Raoultella planticola]|uniref:N-acetyltransferase domain-containing protein n=1 Tax=Raoultella planticola TaxID=575 RepID=A0A485ARK5_RAOPL|nr:Uncharacterised protein [Raoultella planticola]